MKRRDDNAYRAWRRKRLPRPKFTPNYAAMRQYEEAIILADSQRLTGPITAKALRQQEPMRYSVKLAAVLQRMGQRGGPLKPIGAHRAGGHLVPAYRLKCRRCRGWGCAGCDRTGCIPTAAEEAA